MRDFSVLSDVEFEELVADLFSAELVTHVERFARGRDGGVDLRWSLDAGGVGIGQCKHYMRSPFSQLLRAAKSELPHLRTLKPGQYRFVTSQDLSPGQKTQIVDVLKPWLSGPEDVFAGRDVDGLITRFSAVEQAHPKLWLSTGTQLFWATHSDIASRSAALRDRISQSLPRYVPNESFSVATSMLEKERVCVIAGLPGIGKTTLAYALMAGALSQNYQPIEVSADINEAWTAFRPDAPQIFLYDDFLGQLTFSERMGKNEDSRLADFIQKIAALKSKLLIMTTREYILQDARRTYSRLATIDSDRHLILELSDYKRAEKAKILYNHLWHSKLPGKALAEIGSDGYIEIIDHTNYSPRLIEYCTGPAFEVSSPGYPARFLENLNHPGQLWQNAFENHLTHEQQLLAVALATLPAGTDKDDLESAHTSLCMSRNIRVNAALFRAALQVMEGTFLSIDMFSGTSLIKFHNPSIRAFVLDWISGDRQLLVDLIGSSQFFEQVSSLYQFASGFRLGVGMVEPSSNAFATTLGALTANIRERLQMLIASPTPERGGKYLGDRIKPVESWFETRLQFLLQLPPDVRPSPDWLEEQLEAAAARWSRSVGDKAQALRLLEMVESGTITFSSSTVGLVITELDAWLGRHLEDTEEDWIPLLTRLEAKDGNAFEEDEELAAEFQQHAYNELDNWTPSPPNLSDLTRYATRFNLSELVDALDDKSATEAQEDETNSAPAGISTAIQNHTVSEALISDQEISAMFNRFTTAVDENH